MIRKFSNYFFISSVALLLTNCSSNINTKESASSTNPLLDKWTGPYNGVPAFDKFKVEDFKPALEAAMDENRTEINKLANNSEAPTFQNTIEGLEKTGTTLRRVMTVYGIWKSNLSTPQLDTIQE